MHILSTSFVSDSCTMVPLLVINENPTTRPFCYVTGGLVLGFSHTINNHVRSQESANLQWRYPFACHLKTWWRGSYRFIFEGASHVGVSLRVVKSYTASEESFSRSQGSAVESTGSCSIVLCQIVRTPTGTKAILRVYILRCKKVHGQASFSLEATPVTGAGVLANSQWLPQRVRKRLQLFRNMSGRVKGACCRP